MEFDRFFGRQYNKHTSTCFDLVADFYEYNLKINLREALPAFTNPHSRRADVSKFTQLAKPVNLCLCAFKPYNTRIEVPHVGIYWNGEVFHIDEDGVKFSNFQIMGLCFASVRFYAYNR